MKGDVTMKRNNMIRLAAFLMMLVTLAFSVNAMGSARYIGNSSVNGSVGNGSYTVYARSDKEIDQITVEGTLYEKGWFGIWKQVDSCSGSSNTQSCIVTGSFDCEDGKDYRLDYSATFSYTDGQSETLTGSASL